MVDRSCDEATINTMTALINAQKGVDHIDVLQTRKFGCRIYVDVEVSADDDLTLLEAHTIAENIHKAIESNFSEVKHCMVHVNPCSEVHHDSSDGFGRRTPTPANEGGEKGFSILLRKP